MRWAFPLAVFLPIVLLQLPLDDGIVAELGWQIDTVTAAVLGGVLIYLWARQPRARLVIAYGVLAAALAVTAALVVLSPQFFWFGIGVFWCVAMLGALCASWSGPWPRDRQPLILAVVCGVLAGLSPLLVGLETATYLMPLFTLLAAAALGVGFMVRAQRLRLQEQQIEARDRERRAMAAELHDVIAHELTGVVVLAQAVGQGTGDPQARLALERIELSGKRALGHIRSLVSTLRESEEPAPALGTPVHGTLSDVDAVVEQFRQTTGAAVTLSGTGLQVPGPAALTAQRIVSEALTNIHRHASSATAVEVHASITDDVLTIEVQDDGRGGGLGPGSGSGLRGIAERAALLGGTVTAGPRESGGWAVSARIPLATEGARS